MENRSGIITRARKAKQEAKKKIQINLSDRSVRADKMDAKNVGAKEKIQKRDSKSRVGKKTQTIIQPEAGPSSQNTFYNTPLIEKRNIMIVCKYKLPDKLNSKPTNPYEVRWGQKFLDRLVPNNKNKSILKKSRTGGKTKRTKFSNTTVYYFQRTYQRFTPEEKAVVVSMQPHHFYSNFLPVDDFEAQKESRQKRSLAAMRGHNTNDKEESKFVFPGETSERAEFTHTIQVPDELMSKNDKTNTIQNVKKGCGCNHYCDPDICECNLIGKRCEVFKDNFPCGCKLKYCKNTNGREAYNNKNIVTNNSDRLAAKIKEIQNGRVNKQYQITTVRYIKN